MKKLFAIIGILLVIFFGMVIYKYTTGNNNVTIEEVEKIENYISKLYMWKEITNIALPTFDNINNADDLWIWEVVKKNSEEYEMSYEQIEEKAKSLFGQNFNKEFPREGTTEFVYDEESNMYIATEVNLDLEEDTFLLNYIEKKNNQYIVEVVEYLEDYSSEENIIIKNTDEEEIARVSSEKTEIEIKDIVKNSLDRFKKKKVYLNEKDIIVEKIENI